MPTSREIEVRTYQPGDEHGILDLFNEVFGADSPQAPKRTLEHWRWEFERNPAGMQIVVGVEPGGRIVAHYACLPAFVRLRGEVRVCGQGVDSVVHPDYRRGLKREGAFLKVARRYFEIYGRPEVNAFGYGFPNRKAFRIGVRMLGYTPVASPVRTVARNLINFRDDREVSAGADPTGDVVRVSAFDERVDRLWRRVEERFPMAIVRDRRYLQWRYLDCPSVRYEVFALTRPGGEWRAFWVLRRDWMGPPILAVCELFGDPSDTGALARALDQICSHAREHAQLRVETWVPPTHPYFDALLERGFTAEDSPFHLCIRIYEPSLTPSWARAHWYYTIGDSDVF